MYGEPIGFYLDCDTAVCADCYWPDEWQGFEDWSEPLAIMADDESDTPTHCAECESLISHALTPEGYAYVTENVRGTIAGDGGRTCIVAAWWREYGDGCDVSDDDRETFDIWAAAQPDSDDWSPGGPKDHRRNA